jgi:hypothetical protein
MSCWRRGCARKQSSSCSWLGPPRSVRQVVCLGLVLKSSGCSRARWLLELTHREVALLPHDQRVQVIQHDMMVCSKLCSESSGSSIGKFYRGDPPGGCIASARHPPTPLLHQQRQRSRHRTDRSQAAALRSPLRTRASSPPWLGNAERAQPDCSGRRCRCARPALPSGVRVPSASKKTSWALPGGPDAEPVMPYSATTGGAAAHGAIGARPHDFSWTFGHLHDIYANFISSM